jgi:hypothetical protein
VLIHIAVPADAVSVIAVGAVNAAKVEFLLVQ